MYMTTLKMIYKQFSTEEDCLLFLEKVIWGAHSVCPYCRGGYITRMPSEMRHHCNSCNRSFSITVGTLFHKTKCDLQKWFYLIYIYMNLGRFPSAREAGKELNVTKDTALRMCKKINTTYIHNKSLLDSIFKTISNE
jgi:transposase-like protein